MAIVHESYMNFYENSIPLYTYAAMPKLAHSYVPYQMLVHLYPPMKGLKQGTIFPELDRPYGFDPEYTIDE